MNEKNDTLKYECKDNHFLAKTIIYFRFFTAIFPFFRKLASIFSKIGQFFKEKFGKDIFFLHLCTRNESSIHH